MDQISKLDCVRIFTVPRASATHPSTRPSLQHALFTCQTLHEARKKKKKKKKKKSGDDITCMWALNWTLKFRQNNMKHRYFYRCHACGQKLMKKNIFSRLCVLFNFYEYISRKWNKGVIWDFLGNVFSNRVVHWRSFSAFNTCDWRQYCTLQG